MLIIPEHDSGFRIIFPKRLFNFKLKHKQNTWKETVDHSHHLNKQTENE